MNSQHRANRLISEKSPYLLQHAYNPVDWYPWSEEAFAAARERDLPIFLSIGYSTCHWCHVMERESFEDDRIARLLNDWFVAIKVDREERPDVDHVYLAVCQMLTGSAGWPLTIVMTPDKQPFFAGTYFPPEGRWGRIGMTELLPRIRHLWTTGRAEVAESAQQILQVLRATAQTAPPGDLGEDVLHRAYEQLSRAFDEYRGGFGGAPKFPAPHSLLFLLRYWNRTREPRALAMVEKTLTAMHRGGIFDQLGFGFHRYSTDVEWLVPHFEKMLYDQAMLTIAYTEAYQATAREEYGEAVRQIVTYVLRDLRDPEGGFHAAEDADSEGQEGLFYLWTAEEVRRELPGPEGDLFAEVFGVRPEGNYIEQPERGTQRGNILHLRRSPSELASALGMTQAALTEAVERARMKLLAVRQGRIRPLRDDKVLVDWNGLMIAGLAKAAQVFSDRTWTRAAEEAAVFLLGRLRDAEGHLLHRYRDGEAACQGGADDYAFLVWGLIELYETTFDARFLKEAVDLNRQMLEYFWDEEGSGLFFSPAHGEPLPVRQKPLADGATPSANSAALLNLLRLGRMTGDRALKEKARQMMAAFSGEICRAPMGYTHFLLGVDFALGPSREVVLVGDAQQEGLQRMLCALRSRFLPNRVTLLHPEGDADPRLAQLAPSVASRRSIDGRPTAYVCTEDTCLASTTDPEVMLKQVLGETP